MQQRKETQTETAKVLDDAYQHPSKLGYNWFDEIINLLLINLLIFWS